MFVGFASITTKASIGCQHSSIQAETAIDVWLKLDGIFQVTSFRMAQTQHRIVVKRVIPVVLVTPSRVTSVKAPLQIHCVGCNSNAAIRPRAP